jgi:AraC family transcriptional regulator, regulatory protein of adaptative response / methylated-DNA-[protein]-cysteine methyltransferase
MDLMMKNGVTQSKARAEPTAEILFYATGESDLGEILVAHSSKGVCAILIGDCDKELVTDLLVRFPKATLVRSQAFLRDDLSKVVVFANKPTQRLDLTLDMRGTPLQRRVWEAIRNIPVGRTVSYMHLARVINCVYPNAAARVVANACAANPLALAIPCHRVVRSDGGLAGFRWGLERKRKLIAKEATSCGPVP